MQDAQTVLVILLSIGFLILLVMGILVTFVAFKILSNIRRISERVDESTQNINETIRYVGKKVGPAAASAVASVLLRTVKSSFKKGKKHE